ncbi:MAG TPA: hypothetical protein VG456_22835 [Candidatus Sulfopaludibacter sp.]|jgi:hypothetical protein|nr:hypothetical protein [Candidatus Sulfopaludibacter sp.]
MSIRTTVTLDEDVLERVKAESRNRGASFRDTLNDLLRLALVTQSEAPARKPFKVRGHHMGLRPGLSYDNIEELLEYAEGADHR